MTVDNLSSTAVSPEPTKGSTKTFDQSDFDSMIAREKRKIEDKYKDYGDLKGQVENLIKEKKEREEAEMSELQKAQSAIEELTTENAGYKTTIRDYTLKETRNKVLSEDKYKNLTYAYKNLVELNENEDIVKESADKIYEQFQGDLKQLGVKDDNFGVGNPIRTHTDLKNKIQNKGYGEQLKDKWKQLHSS